MTTDLAGLDERFQLATTELFLPTGPCTVTHPRDADDLISEADYARDERLPYWADIWPSSIALATCLADLAPKPARLLELGSGVGVVTIAALRAGHDVLATDYYADALLFTRRNALAGAGREPATRLADWRAWPGDLGRFDLVVASDVLYERPYAEIVAGVIATSLEPGGAAFIADPGRLAVPAFVAAATARGLDVRTRLTVPHKDGAIRQVITIHEIRVRAT